jgi:uncharacterized protein
MKKLLDILCLYFEAIPERLRKKRLIMWVFFIIATTIVGFGIPRNTFDMSLDSWFSKDDPIQIALNHFRAQFGSDEVIYLVYRPKDGDLFSEASLTAVEGIRDDILNFRKNLKSNLKQGEVSALEHITKVDTIASVRILKAENDSLISKKFIGKDFPKNEAEKEALKIEAKKQKNFPLFYFSNDFQYGAIYIQTDMGAVPVYKMSGSDAFDTEEDEFDDSEEETLMEVDEAVQTSELEFKITNMNEYADLMDAVDKIISQPKYADNLDYYPVGTPPMMQFFVEQVKEMGPLFGGMLIVMVILLWLLFRSLSAVVWPVVVVVLSCICVVGLSGWAGAVITTMVTLTVLLVLAIGIADSIHIISGYMLFRNQNFDHKKALSAAFAKAALPCLLTTVTTMLGMLALTLSSINHIKTFGYMSSVGVGFAFLFTIFFLPLALDLWSPVSKKKSFEAGKSEKKLFFFNPYKLTQALLNKVLPIVDKAPIMIIGFFLIIFLACLYGTAQVRIDSDFVKSTKKGSLLRQNYEVADKHMSGTQNMEIYINASTENVLQSPEVLKAMDSLQEKIESKYGNLVVRTNSLADVVKDAYQLLNGGKEEYYKIPDDPKTLTQTLFMFNNANPEDRSRLVSDDYSESHISIQLYNAGSYEYTGFFSEVKKDINETFDSLKKDFPLMNVSITGGLALVMKLADYIAWSQAKSLTAVILIISLILIFVFGSAKVGFMSIIPNLIPATLTFGLLGLFGIPLDSDTMIIAPVIIGIAVDDTIHFITHYRGEVLKDGNIRKAIQNTLEEVGQAIFFTTLILGCGFFIMSFSSNTSMIKVGIFGSMAIFMALFCDLFLLPALILVFKPKFLTRAQKTAFPAYMKDKK